MKERGLALLLATSLLMSCPLPILQDKNSQPKRIIVGLYDRGMIFLEDRDYDGKLDTTVFYKLVDLIPTDSPGLSNELFIMDYDHTLYKYSGKNKDPIPNSPGRNLQPSGLIHDVRLEK
jgi:hypothetical protein